MINGIIKLFYSEVVKTNMKKMPNGEYSLKDEYKEIKNLTLKIDSLALNIIKLIIVMITLILAFEINTLLGIGLFLIEFLYIKKHLNMKFSKKEFLLKSNNLIYFILFPCDLTRENFENILTNPSLELKKKIEHFYQNNIDWVKIRNTTGELDYSKQFLRNAYVKKKIS